MVEVWRLLKLGNEAKIISNKYNCSTTMAYNVLQSTQVSFVFKHLKWGLLPKSKG